MSGSCSTKSDDTTNALMQQFMASPIHCKLHVKRNDDEIRKAEVLWARESTTASPGLEYYVHYVELNKRLDEWVPFDRLEFSQGVEFPKPEPKKKKESAKSRLGTSQTAPSNQKQKEAEDMDNDVPSTSGDGRDKDGGVVLGREEEDGDEVIEESTGPQTFSKEQELEKLRTSGSMTQCVSEIARVKNLDKIEMGKHQVETWYFSPYPKEYAHCDTLYICEFCLCYYASHKQLERHRGRCQLLHPPGNEVYRHQDISFFEIDGRKQRTWCRNLCLLSKLFLDHKTLYYDVDPFLFYCMTLRDERGCHLIGYFSKEKESMENYNVACILTLPQYQRHGFGRLLIAFSYALSLAEGQAGSPEKPLSDLGLLSYRAYWADTVVGYLLGAPSVATIDEISQQTSITPQDILHTLQTLGSLKYYKSQHIICLGDKVIERWEQGQKKKRRTIVPEKLQWKPPSRSQRL